MCFADKQALAEAMWLCIPLACTHLRKVRADSFCPPDVLCFCSNYVTVPHCEFVQNLVGTHSFQVVPLACVRFFANCSCSTRIALFTASINTVYSIPRHIVLPCDMILLQSSILHSNDPALRFWRNIFGTILTTYFRFGFEKSWMFRQIQII